MISIASLRSGSTGTSWRQKVGLTRVTAPPPKAGITRPRNVGSRIVRGPTPAAPSLKPSQVPGGYGHEAVSMAMRQQVQAVPWGGRERAMAAAEIEVRTQSKTA